MKSYWKYTVNWKVNTTLVSLALLITPAIPSAKSISGIIDGGGGIDDISIKISHPSISNK